MCTVTTFIKLCTCGDKIPEDSYWELFPGGAVEKLAAVGSFAPPPDLPLETRFLNAKIEEDLNSHNCFDFAYTAKGDDVLRVHFGGRTLEFHYSEGRSSDQPGMWASSRTPVLGAIQPERKGSISLEHGVR